MKSKKIHKIKHFSPYHIIALNFLILILAGSALLSLPFVTNSGESTDFLTAIFTSTSAVCVTGLSVVTTLEHWNLLGKI